MSRSSEASSLREPVPPRWSTTSLALSVSFLKLTIVRFLPFFLAHSNLPRAAYPPRSRVNRCGRSAAAGQPADELAVGAEGGLLRVVVAEQPVVLLEALARGVVVPQVEPAVVGDVVVAAV